MIMASEQFGNSLCSGHTCGFDPYTENNHDNCKKLQIHYRRKTQMAKKTLEDILLDKAGVDLISQQIQSWLTEAKMEHRNITRLRLGLENLLEDLCVHYDRKALVSVEMKQRFGRTSLLIRYPGEAYRPGQNSADVWTNMLLSQIGLMPIWHHRHGVNELSLKLAGNKIRSELWLIIAFVSAVVFGLCKPLLPEALTSFLNTWVFTNLSDVFMNLLGTFAGVLVFLSVISGICGIGNISDFSKMGGYLISRNLLTSFAGAGLCAVLMIPCFSFRYGNSAGASELSAVAQMIFAIIPKDPVTPFQTGNTLQIVFMAVLIGATTVMLGSQAARFREILIQFNGVVLKLISGICRFLPVYIFSSLTSMFWVNGMSIFRTIWKPLVLCMAMSLLLMAISLVHVSLRFHVPLSKLVKKILPGYLIGVTTASSTAAFGTILEENEKGLGIDPQLSNFGTPLEMILNASTMSAGFLAIVYFLIEYSGIEITPIWFVSAWLLVTIIAFALPPVSGGTLIGLSVILTQFHIDPSCLGMAGTLVLVGDFFMTSARIVILQMELVHEAAHWKILDIDRLRA